MLARLGQVLVKRNLAETSFLRNRQGITFLYGRNLPSTLGPINHNQHFVRAGGKRVAQDDTRGLFWRAGVAYSHSSALRDRVSFQPRCASEN